MGEEGEGQGRGRCGRCPGILNQPETADGTIVLQAVEAALTPGMAGPVVDAAGALALASARGVAPDLAAELITAATHEYLDSGMTYDGFSEHVRTTWRNAAAYDWSKLMAEPRSTGEWSSDANRLAVLGVTMQFAPESTCMMIASDILAENAPLSLPALRERINTPDGMVNTDLLFSRLIDNGTTPDPARIDMAMGILGPLEANAPTDACYRIIGLKAMLSLAMGDGEKARELAEQAIGYDASDRFASSVLDRLPETDPAMEAANVWENGGHLGR